MPSKNRSIVGTLLTASLLGVSGFLVWKYALNSPENWEETKQGLDDLFERAKDEWDEWDLGNFTNVLDGLDGFSFGDLFNEDPMLGDNSTLAWKNALVERDGGGLHLTLRNALDDNWQREFDLAVADWQQSDALVLSTERVAVDHTCGRVDGVMVVCNANFGATGWVGINENSILRGVIVSSVAKMNEYYLNNANFAHRRYTMCHELGHGEWGGEGGGHTTNNLMRSTSFSHHVVAPFAGFGLPHTDENPYNSNLENCLGERRVSCFALLRRKDCDAPFPRDVSTVPRSSPDRAGGNRLH